MAKHNYSHTAEIMKASIPYFDSRTRPKIEFVSKLLDLVDSLSIFGRENMVACGYEALSIDVEGLLNGIRPLCDSKEREFVDRILNIFNMKRMFEMYNNFMSTMQTMQDAGGFPFGDSGGDDTDNVTGNFTGMNYDSIFQAFHDIHPDNPSMEEEDNIPPPAGNSEEQEQKQNSDSNESMFEMFKNMISPEQMQTFENLRMLFNTMSYDNNNREENEEHSDG